MLGYTAYQFSIVGPFALVCFFGAAVMWFSGSGEGVGRMTRQDYINAILKLLEKADFRQLRLVWVHASHLIEKEGASA